MRRLPPMPTRTYTLFPYTTLFRAAVAPRDPRTHRNEGEHVEALVADREPGALEEGPARPENDGGREQQLNPVARLATDILVEARNMAAHFSREAGEGE